MQQRHTSRWRRSVFRKKKLAFDHQIRVFIGFLHITVLKKPVRINVAADIVMQNWGVRFGGLFDVHHDRQRLVLDFDHVQRVFSDVAVIRNNDGYRFTDVTDLVHCTAVILGWNRHAHRKWLRHRCHVITGQNTSDSGNLQGLGYIHPP